MSERLTVIDSDGTVCRANCTISDGDAWDCLAAYEDLGTVEELAELVEAHKDGRLVVLPCKAGDTVWAYSEFGNQIVPYTVEFIGISDLAIQFDCNWYSYSECTEDTEFELSDFGKTVFLTREEAEAALKEVSHE